MKDLLVTLERMAAYEKRVDSKKLRIKTHRQRIPHSRGIETDAEDSGLEQWLSCGLTEAGEVMWYRQYNSKI